MRWLRIAAIGLTSCAAILGIEENEYRPPEVSEDGGADGIANDGDATIDAAPVLLADKLESPSAIAVGSDEVFVSIPSTNTILAFGTSGERVVTTAAVEPVAIAVDRSTLRWAASDFENAKGGFWACTLPACTDARRTTTFGNMLDAVFREGFAYGLGGELVRAPIEGGDASTISDVDVRTFTTDDEYLYGAYPTEHLLKIRISDGQSQRFSATELTKLGRIAVDDARVYWTFTDATGIGRVFSSDKNATETISYGSEGTNLDPYGIAVDDARVYWTVNSTTKADIPQNDGKLFACAKLGCEGAPLVLTSDLTSRSIVTITSSAIYVLELGERNARNGRLRRFVKP